MAEHIRSSVDSNSMPDSAIDSLRNHVIDMRRILDNRGDDPVSLSLAIANDALIQSLCDNCNQAIATTNTLSARLDDVLSTLQRIESRQAAPPPHNTATAASPIPHVAPAPALARVERMLAELTTALTSLKRARFPSPSRDSRAVRARLEDAAVAVPPVAAAAPLPTSAPPAGIFHVPAVSAPPTGIFYASAVSAMPPTTPALPAGVVHAAAAVSAPPTTGVHLPAVSAPQAGVILAPSSNPTPSTGIFVAPSINRHGKITTPAVPHPEREARMGPGVWGRDITTHALVVIQAVLPGFEWKDVFLRAHRLESDKNDKAS
ncbi:hypothetical protein B0H14DRAFT_2558955 [Mycena olivaceomarginata]|nr:hypothetical protein B0H14DRAFT_2558955 [Mycena olivaceomarginata]